MSSRERNMKLIAQNNKQIASYVSGIGINKAMSDVKKRASVMGVNAQQQQPGYLNRKASEDNFSNN